MERTMNRSSLHIALGDAPVTRSLPAADVEAHGDDLLPTESFQNQSEPTLENIRPSQTQKPDYFVEVIIPRAGRVSHVSDIVLPVGGLQIKDEKSSSDSSPSSDRSPNRLRKQKIKDRKKSKCGFWIWIYLFVVILTVICLIVMFLLWCVFMRNLQSDTNRIRQELKGSQNESMRNKNIMEESELQLSTVGNNTEQKNKLTERERLILDKWRIKDENVYYKIKLGNASYSKAKEICNIKNGRLASKMFRNNLTSNDIEYLNLHRDNKKIWVGYSRISNGSDWMWADEQNTKHSPYTFKWNRREPQQEIGFDCAFAVTEKILQVNHTIIQSENCGTALPFICEVDFVSSF